MCIYGCSKEAYGIYKRSEEKLAWTLCGTEDNVLNLMGYHMSHKEEQKQYIGEEAQKQIKANIEYYRRNAKIIKEGLEKAGYEVYGGVNAPYIWLKVPKEYTSWEFFDFLLEEKNIVRNTRSRIW